MKIPPDIKEHMRKAAKYYEKARMHGGAVREWLDSIGQGENDYILDEIIDCIEMSNNPDKAIKSVQVHLDLIETSDLS